MKSALKQYPVTYTLIIINLIVYLVSAMHSNNLMDMNNQVLLDMGANFGPYMIKDGQWWRLFAALFLHAGITHILMNMYSLYIVGRSVEMYFTPMQYITIYLLSGLVGGVVSVYMHPLSIGIGASGAIFGVFGALAGFFLAHRAEIGKQGKAFFANFGSVLVLNFVIGLTIPSIDMSAHIGGLLAGALGGYMIGKNPKSIWSYMMVVGIFIMIAIRYMPAITT